MLCACLTRRAALTTLAPCMRLAVLAWAVGVGPAASCGGGGGGGGGGGCCAWLTSDPNGTARTTGFVSADQFGAVPDGLTVIDNAPKLRGAVSCFPQVFIASGDYNVNTTLVFADQFGPGSGISIGQMTRLRGVSHEKPPRTLLHSSNESGPVIQLGSWHAKYSSGAAYYLERLAIAGQFIGVKIIATSSVNMHQVHISAKQWAVEPVDIPDATALLITGCFWLWFEECAFSAAAPPGAWAKTNLGTRPSVIMRGEPTPNGSLATNNVRQTYLVRFSKAQFNYGGVKYEQNVSPFSGRKPTTRHSPQCSIAASHQSTTTCQCNQLAAVDVTERSVQLRLQFPAPIGFWDFLTVSQEDSFTPLLEITGNGSQPLDPKHHQPTAKFAQVSIQGYMDADAGGSAGGPVIRLNLTNSTLDGVTLFGVGDVESPFGAIEVVNGRLGSVNILDTRSTGAVNADKHPVGSVFAKSAGGISVTGLDPHCEAGPECHRQRSVNDSRAQGSETAISVAIEGDEYLRLAVLADGSLAYGSVAEDEVGSDGPSPPTATGPGFDTVFRRPIARTVQWAPKLVVPLGLKSSTVSISIDVPGAMPGDACSVGLAALGDVDALLSANVAAKGRVRVVLHYLGMTTLQLPESTLRVVVSQFA